MTRLLILALVALFAAAPLETSAQDLEDEARRQLTLAKEDFANGAFERAAAACTSALRLDPTRREAFKLKGLALEQLGEDKEALAMLGAYRSLSTGLPADPSVDAAIERLERKLEIVVSPVPAALGISGGLLAAGGLTVSAVGFSQVASSTRQGEHLGTPEGYRSAFGLHVGGIVASGVGVGLGVAGLVSGLLQRSRIRSIRSGGVAARPVVVPGVAVTSHSVHVGFSGRW